MDLVFPRELDRMGRSHGDISLMGVVHIDGNGLGRRILDWMREQRDAEVADAALIEDYRRLSRALDGLAHAAFQAVVDRVISAIAWDDDDKSHTLRSERLGMSFPLLRDPKAVRRPSGSRDAINLPLRHILVGGDDLTFVCDGRIALDLAETALDVFRSTPLGVPGFERVGACAGVALVQVHAPFARAYQLAERLCRNAKLKLCQNAGGAEVCGVDWHIGLPPATTSIEALRAIAYQDGSTTLSGRPYELGERAVPKRGSWRRLSQSVLGHTTASGTLRGHPWLEHRNKLKALPELLREPESTVTHTLDAWRLVGRDLKLPDVDLAARFQEDRGLLLDAVELMDIHWPLDPREDEHS